MGNSYTISARLIDVGSGKIMRTATEDTDERLESILKFTMSDISRGIAGLKIHSRKNPLPNLEPGDCRCFCGYRRGVVVDV